MLGAAGIWYFFIKDDHYRIRFTYKQPPGVVYQHILGWNKYATPDIDAVTVNSSIPFQEIDQTVRVGDSVFNYQWEITKENDSTTRVSLGIKDLDNPLAQKFEVPFSNNEFVNRSIRSVKDIGSELKILTNKFKVHSIKDTLVQPSFCAYLPLNSKVDKKASTMLYNITLIMGYINENELELKGDPFLEVTNWDKQSNTMSYNFCFPIKKRDSLPPNPEIQFKTTPEFNALKAEFNGNYSISNNAWYYLLDHAQRNAYRVKELPVEYYLSDPHIGGDPLLWKALILLPLED